VSWTKKYSLVRAAARRPRNAAFVKLALPACARKIADPFEAVFRPAERR
jgi:hypothetical protein